MIAQASEPDTDAADPRRGDPPLLPQHHAALRAIDQANNTVEVVINRCRAIVDTLLVSVDELRHFTAQAWPTRCGCPPTVVRSMAQIRFGSSALRAPSRDDAIMEDGSPAVGVRYRRSNLFQVDAM